MEALKEDPDDQCWCSQLCWAKPDNINPDISLSDYDSKSLRGGNPSLLYGAELFATLKNCPDISFVENGENGLKWLGYRSKEENKTPTTGVSAI